MAICCLAPKKRPIPITPNRMDGMTQTQEGIDTMPKTIEATAMPEVGRPP